MRKAGSERGSVLLLTIGLAVLALLVVLVVVDASTAFLQRRSLAGVADAAAIAGAQAVDLDRLYADGVAAGIVPLDGAGVEAAVRRQLSQSEAGRAVPGFALESVRTDGRTVTVTVRGALDLPFAAILPSAAPRVLRVTAHARLQLH